MKPRYTREQFIQAANEAKNIRQLLLKLGLNDRGRAYQSIKNVARKLAVDISHLIDASKYGYNKKLYGKILDEEIINSVNKNISMMGVLKTLGLSSNSGSNNRWVRNAVKRLGIDTSHFKGQAHLRGKAYVSTCAQPLENILVQNSTFSSTHHLKHKLLKTQTLDNICSFCGIKTWQNKPLSLHLDHINGNNKDNRLENLRLLCPNCHSQTETFAGKNKIRNKII